MLKLAKILPILILSCLIFCSCSGLETSSLKIDLEEVIAIRPIVENEVLWLFNHISKKPKKYSITSDKEISFTNDNCQIIFKFNEGLKKDDLRDVITIVPDGVVDVNISDNKVTIKPMNLNVGDIVDITLNVNKQYKFSLKKADITTVVSSANVYPFERESLQYLTTEDETYNMSSGSTMLIKFSNEVDKNSVLKSLHSQFDNKQYSVEPDFINEKELLLTFVNKTSKDTIVYFTLNNATDSNGCHISDNGYYFYLISKGNLTLANVDTYDENTIIKDKVLDYAFVNKEATYIITKEIVKERNKIEDSFLNIYDVLNNSSTSISRLFNSNTYNPNEAILFNNCFFYLNSVYDYKGNKLYALTENIAGVNKSYDNSNLIFIHYEENDLDDINIILSLYDLNAKRVTSSYCLGSYKLDEIEDFNNLKNVKLLSLSKSRFAYEYYDTKSGRYEIRLYDLESKEEVKLIEGKFAHNNAISPNNNFIFIKNNSSVSLVNVENKENIFYFPKYYSVKNIVWLDDNNVIFNNNSDVISKLNLKEKEIVKTSLTGNPIICTKKDTILLIKKETP